MAAIWDDLAGAAICGRLGASLCKALETRQARFQRPPGGMYGGWHQYMSKDLRRLAGGAVRGPMQLRYCGNGDAARCADRAVGGDRQGRPRPRPGARARPTPPSGSGRR